ncbi:MAG: peroxiredoxin [Parachlamydiales bacterium]|nr:peroxiredoxin [Parachlamydiales bacterium]
MGSLVGQEAPNFCVQAVVDGEIFDNFSLADHKGKYIILLFYPLDFTFVCPTELHAFQEKLSEFQERNALVIGCSIDSPYCHMAWLKTPKSTGGIEGIHFPLISDLNKQVAKLYDVLNEDAGVAYRGLFLIDKDGVIRHMTINDLAIGRSVDEALRVLDALLYHEKHGEVCPANWSKGSKGFKPTQQGLKDFYVEV